MKPIIESIIIDGNILYATEMCSIIKKSSSDVEDFLQYIYSQYGYNSTEFVFIIQGFIFKLLNFYAHMDNYDLVMEIISKILEKMEKYEIGKGKLSSYLYTITRGEITKWRSKMRYYDKIFMDMEENKYNNIEDQSKEYVYKYDGTTVYYRAQMWNIIKEDLWK